MISIESWRWGEDGGRGGMAAVRSWERQPFHPCHWDFSTAGQLFPDRQSKRHHSTQASTQAVGARLEPGLCTWQRASTLSCWLDLTPFWFQYSTDGLELLVSRPGNTLISLVLSHQASHHSLQAAPGAPVAQSVSTWYLYSSPRKWVHFCFALR